MDATLSITELTTQFAHCRALAAEDPYPSLPTRIQWLDALARMLLEQQDALLAAINKDFGHRSSVETQMLELFPLLQAVRHSRRQLRKWMRPRKRAVSMWFKPGRALVIPQPLGVAGIIVPWNYPLFLSLGPLISAFAAGNRVLLKMSELTPYTGALLAELCQRYLTEQAWIINGDVEVAQAFSALPFDHLLFTGSTAVGRHVMQAASANLTPVTLELGGKSPCLIAPDYPLAHAAERVMIGKLMNAGQTCIAPDYVLVYAPLVEQWVAAAQTAVARYYPRLRDNPDYSAIINAHHLARLTTWLEEARTRGAVVHELNPAAESLDGSGKFAPCLVVGAPEDCAVMREEIFGPILPVVPYRTLKEALAYIQSHPRPLAFYYFDRDNSRIQQVLAHTHAGGVSINDTILHVAQDDLPFGGVGSSGMGHYHGREGFDTFSKLKPVFLQARWNAAGLLAPPYGRISRWLLRWMLR